jgi:hypothetical protein
MSLVSLIALGKAMKRSREYQQFLARIIYPATAPEGWIGGAIPLPGCAFQSSSLTVNGRQEFRNILPVPEPHNSTVYDASALIRSTGSSGPHLRSALVRERQVVR